jgi:xanthine dehydrogenase small subunit
MRDFVLLYVNGVEYRVGGEDAFMSLSDYLRYSLSKCGTKVVCAEGDCGACTVFLGRLNAAKSGIEYIPVNACIQYMYQLDCTHIVTVEGLKVDGDLNRIQQSMVDCHGAQCGYCTPGFIVAMCSLFEQCDKSEKPCSVTRQDVSDALTGNLCRCTGYEAIIKAAMSVDEKEYKRLENLYPPQTFVAAFKKHHEEPVLVKGDEAEFFKPTDVKSAVEYKSKNSGAVIVSGGTDVCVNLNKGRIEPRNVLVLTHVAGLEELKLSGDTVEVGARVTLRRLEEFFQKSLPEFHHILWIFGSPQIRYAGTLAGNIANGSPIADSLPFLFVSGAEVEVAGLKGERRIKVNQLYSGYRKMVLTDDEIIVRVHIPLPSKATKLKLYKVSKREHLDISSFTAAISLERNGDKIANAQVAYGGVAAVVLKLAKTEEFLNGKAFTLETFREAGEVAMKEITPISDVRGSKDYRLQLAANIMEKFYFETAEEKELVCL